MNPSSPSIKHALAICSVESSEEGSVGEVGRWLPLLFRSHDSTQNPHSLPTSVTTLDNSPIQMTNSAPSPSPANSPLRPLGEDKTRLGSGLSSTEPSLSTTPALLNARPPPTTISSATQNSSASRLTSSSGTSQGSSERSSSRPRIFTNIFKGKRSSQDEVEHVSTGGLSSPNGGTETSPVIGDIGPTLTTRPVVSSPPSSSSAQFSVPSGPTASTSRGSKPPVSLFQNIRNRRSSSIERAGIVPSGGEGQGRRPSDESRSFLLRGTRRGSSQDEASLGVASSPASTVATTPETTPPKVVPTRLSALSHPQLGPRVPSQAPSLSLDLAGSENLEGKPIRFLRLCSRRWPVLTLMHCLQTCALLCLRLRQSQAPNQLRVSPRSP